MDELNLSSLWSVEGKAYLEKVQHLALDPSLVELRVSEEKQQQIYCTIAQTIPEINQQLETYLACCQQCFYPQQHLNVQVFAVPFAQHLDIDSLCNPNTDPITILIDVGRIASPDWLRAIAHEYAHAQVKAPGHHQAFLETLTHLCLGLGLSVPPPNLQEEQLRTWPPCQPIADPLAFWLSG